MVKKTPDSEARILVAHTPDSAISSLFLQNHLEKESWLGRSAQVWQMIGQCNRLLMRASEEKTLLQDLCRTIVETGGYQMAWIGFSVSDERKKARRYSQMGFEAGYPENAHSVWTNSKQVNNPVLTALRTHKPAIVQDILSPEKSSTWESKPTEKEFGAAISLPLVYNSQAFGILNVYASQSKAFNPEETKLLIQLADDCSYGIHSLRPRLSQHRVLGQFNTSGSYFQALIQNASDIIMVLDVAGYITFVSTSVQRILGYAPEELIGKDSALYLHPEDDRVIKTVLQSPSGQENINPGNTETRMRHVNSSWLYFDCTVNNQLLDPDIKGLVLTLHDITLHKLAQAKLQKQQKEHQIMFDAVPAMIVFKDASNRILRANKLAASFYGIAREELEGKSLYTLNPAEASRYHQEDLEIISSGIPRLNETEQVKFADGEIRWIQTDKIPFYDEERKAGAIIIFSHEITAHKKLEDALIETLDELKQKNFELDNYFYKVSHDIRAPLCTILGLTNLMKLEKDIAGNEVYIGLIEKSIHKLDSFIQTILNHSRMLNTSTHIQSIDFQQIITQCLNEFTYLPQFFRLKTQIQLHSSNKFYNDASQIAIIFRHLILNALKFMDVRREENLLEVDITITGNKAYISVEDNGIGIQKQYIGKIFDMFFKATDVSDGAGLGLYIVKQTVDKMGGSISVKSKSGKGTVFKIILFNLQGV
ncbi:PAS domain S-box protein [Rhodocytophaga rosea]|uniref:histidine kinase n=1 Tax=Rhodocytophaga rosea TaxID=2704465 RepID=A0A6C0GD59_9BACT|nr:PAS domain S-box protein [Rhodocytophaga rosea]QHT65905.1 PAS domain S-box protein [Rhodocytophaga rosea]